MGFDIVKITPLMQWLPNADAVDGAVVCINLRAPCWSLAMLSYGACGLVCRASGVLAPAYLQLSVVQCKPAPPPFLGAWHNTA